MSSEQERKIFIDIDAALARVRGNKSLYRKMLGLFLVNDEINKLEKSLEEKDYESAEKAAHGIKGMTGNLALNSLFEKSTVLMNQLREGPPEPQAVEEYFDALDKTRVHVLEVMDILDEQKS